jgi:hypothetical protein
MNKLSSIAALVSAALIGIAAESAWSDEATSSEFATPAVQTPESVSGVVPDWYPPRRRGVYAQPWRRPSYRPAPSWDDSQLPAYYPPRGYYRADPDAPVTGPAATSAPATMDNPLSAELQQTQEQLTAKSAELDKANALLEQLRSNLQSSLEDKRTLTEKVANITSEQQALQAQVAELTETLNTTTATLEQHRQQITQNQEQNRALTAERDQLRDDLDSRDEQLAIVQVELQAATHALHQLQAEASATGTQLSEARMQIGRCNNELTELGTELETRNTTLLKTEQASAAVTAERDAQQALLAACSQELTKAQAAVTAARAEVEALRVARPAAAKDVIPPAPNGPYSAVESAASEEPAH